MVSRKSPNYIYFRYLIIYYLFISNKTRTSPPIRIDNLTLNWNTSLTLTPDSEKHTDKITNRKTDKLRRTEKKQTEIQTERQTEKHTA